MNVLEMNYLKRDFAIVPFMTADGIVNTPISIFNEFFEYSVSILLGEKVPLSQTKPAG